MPNAWQVYFEPTFVYLSPVANGKFNAVSSIPGKRVNPPAGSFPIVTALRPHLTVNAKVNPPMKPNDPSKPATLEFLGRPAPATGAAAAPFVSMGTVRGKIGVNTSASPPVPQFICGTRKVPGGGASVVLDFTPGTKPEIQQSDWVMRIEKQADTFDTNAVSSFFVQLPWQFVQNPARMQVTARLTIDGTLETDESVNTPVDIPLRHDGVPEDADPAKPKFTFYGVRNLFTKANDHESSPKVKFSVGIGSDVLAVILHRSFTDFCAATSIDVAKVNSIVADTLIDVGFNPVNFLVGAKADTDCNLHWKQVAGHFMGRKIIETDASLPLDKRLENRFAAAIAANNVSSVTIPNGMEETIPFFDFYIFAEDTDPPNPAELAHSEGLARVRGTIDGINTQARTKSLHTPIVIATKSKGPLRNLLSQIDPSDHPNLLASTICHEIGHTFGLRHMVAFRDALPYVTGDPGIQHGVMGGGGIQIGSGTPRVPVSFFGPVHSQEIKRLFF